MPQHQNIMTHFKATGLLFMVENPEIGLNGVEFLRELVKWLEERGPVKNAKKSPLKLMTEFKTAIENRVNE